MCGIAGILNINQKLVSERDLKRMINIIKHRGPDDEGYFLNKNFGMGNCRLSIIDLSAAGHQPMSNKDKTLWITYDGKVYNFLEIREELERLGYQFKSNTDTEVVLCSYEKWGEKCLNKFNGDFAFAIWDQKNKELFCARDRFGVKPFYYYFNGNIFAFASEIKSLIELGLKKEPNEVLIYDFLRFGMLDHTDETFFEGIKKLPAASWMKVKQNGSLIIKRYWDFEVSDEISGRNGREYAEEFLDLFTDSVKLRLRSDVPIGSCLSGGIDSSSIVCTINGLLKKEKIYSIGEIQKTFSSCFKEKNFDERKYIEEVVKNAKIEKNYIFPKPEEFLKEIDKLIWHQEEPFAGTSIYAQWGVFKRAKEKVKVLLDGQGGDENLCGYRKFYIFYLKKLLENHKYFSFLKEALLFFASPSILKTLGIKSGLRYFSFGEKFLKFKGLFSHKFLEKFKERFLNFNYQGNLGKRIKEDITTWSLPVLLRYEDKNSMAHSLETRLPFLDYRLVEKIASFPLNQKMKNGLTKVILRNAMREIIPEKIRKRKSKLGFSTPEEIWFKKDLKENIKSIIETSFFLPNFINKKELLRAFNKFLSGKSILSSELFFRFYILELWARRFIFNYGKEN